MRFLDCEFRQGGWRNDDRTPTDGSSYFSVPHVTRLGHNCARIHSRISSYVILWLCQPLTPFPKRQINYDQDLMIHVIKWVINFWHNNIHFPSWSSGWLNNNQERLISIIITAPELIIMPSFQESELKKLMNHPRLSRKKQKLERKMSWRWWGT